MDFPDPDGPMTVRNRPAVTSSETPSTALRVVPPTANSFVTSRSAANGLTASTSLTISAVDARTSLATLPPGIAPLRALYS